MANDTWATPIEVYEALNQEFEFCADMAASEDNAKHSVFWAETDAPNSLAMDWADSLEYFESKGSKFVWCNPPYSAILPWVEKAIEAQQNGLGVVMLVMCDPSVAWFALAQEYATETRFITKGRLAFLENGKPKSGNNKGSVIFVFGPKMAGLGKVTFVERDKLIAKGKSAIQSIIKRVA